MTTKEDYLKQHHKQYVNVLKFVVESNTLNLYEQGILSLFKKPPLDSMDLLKKQAIGIAKNNNIVLDIESLEIIFEKYRGDIIEKIKIIQTMRQEQYNNLIDKNDIVNYKVIKILRKQVKEIDKKLVNTFKKVLINTVEDNLVDKTSFIFGSNDYLLSLYNDYLNSKYVEIILSQFESMLAIRNNTLDNALKEQGHRYLFTQKNSHLFD